MTAMKLPAGKTCGNCVHVESCATFGRTSRASTTCQLPQPMFLESTRGSSLLVRQTQEALKRADEAIEWMKTQGYVIEDSAETLTFTAAGLAYAERLRSANPERAKELEERARIVARVMGRGPAQGELDFGDQP